MFPNYRFDLLMSLLRCLVPCEIKTHFHQKIIFDLKLRKMNFDLLYDNI